MAPVFSNNATSLLAVGINSSVTTVTVATGDAAKFPAPTGGDWFPVTIVDGVGNMEIMRCTARSGANLTVVRAQEGTTAQSFSTGARVDLRMTAATLTAFRDMIDGKADDGHGHAIADVTGLQTALDGKSNTDHGHAIGDVTNLATSLNDRVRAVVSPTALSNGATIPSTTSGIFYWMNLSSGVQTATLPSTSGLPDGFSVVVRATGAPSGYQTAFVSGGGKNVSYRAVLSANFHLIGQNEVFRFTWLSTFDVWMAECLAQPGLVQCFRGHNGTTWNAGATALTPVTFNTLGSSHQLFNVSAATSTLVPVAGVYMMNHRVLMSASAGGGTSGNGGLLGITPSSGSANSAYGYDYRDYVLTSDGSVVLNIHTTAVLYAGQAAGAYYQMSVTTLWWFPGASAQNIELVSR